MLRHRTVKMGCAVTIGMIGRMYVGKTYSFYKISTVTTDKVSVNRIDHRTIKIGCTAVYDWQDKFGHNRS